MKNYKEFFKDKKITVMGLGLLGRGIGDAIFLAQCGAKLTITDLKTKEQLKESLKKLAKFKNIEYVLGEHRLEDFKDKDLILKSAKVPLDSIYIREAQKNNIPVEMSTALFVKLSNLPVIGVTGTRGKSTTTHLLEHIFNVAGKKFILGGNVRGVSTLSMLPKAKNADYVLLELDSWQLQGFRKNKTSPHVAVFTTFYPDHMSYYGNDMKKYFIDKASIFKYQKKNDFLITGEQVMSFIKKWEGEIKSKIITLKSNLPKGWKIKIPGEHNIHNASLAIEVARRLGIKDVTIKKAVASFGGVVGRLQYLTTIKGVKIYNDSATTAEATAAALKALGANKNIVLIVGGYDKNLDMTNLVKKIPHTCSKVILFKEKGTDRIRDEVFKMKKDGIEVYEEEGLKNCVKRAFAVAKKRETILFSPAFESFGKYFKNEFDREAQFLKIVKNLKPSRGGQVK